MRRPAAILAALAATFVLALSASVASAQDESEDKYVYYYYPSITSQETFTRVIRPSPPTTPATRVNFVTTITKAQLAAPESPRFVLFEKGSNSEQLIVVALDDQVFKNLYRARAVLAQLTSNMRGTDFFVQQNLHLEGTFYDMLQIMGFKEMVITNGEEWAHHVTFAPEG